MADSIGNTELINETSDTDTELETKQVTPSRWSRAVGFITRKAGVIGAAIQLWEIQQEAEERTTTWGATLNNEKSEGDFDEKTEAEQEESVESKKDKFCYNLKFDDLEQDKQEKIVQKIEEAFKTADRIQSERKKPSHLTPGEQYQSLIKGFLGEVNSPEDISIDYLMQLDVRAGIEMMEGSPPRMKDDIRQVCEEHSPIASYCTQEQVKEYCQKVSEIASDYFDVNKQNYRPERSSRIQENVTEDRDVNTEQKPLSDESQRQWILEQNMGIDM